MFEVVPPEQPGSHPAASAVIESVSLPCGCLHMPDFDQGDRIITCPHHGSKYTIRSRRRVVVSYTVEPCS